MRRGAHAQVRPARRFAVAAACNREDELAHDFDTDVYWGRLRSGIGDNRLGLILMQLGQTTRCGRGRHHAKPSRVGDVERHELVKCNSLWSIAGH